MFFILYYVIFRAVASDELVLLQLRANGSHELLHAQRKWSPPRPEPELGYLTMPSVIDAALDAHNQYRCMHGVPNLEWDEKIARRANEQVKKGVFKHSTAASRVYVDEGGKTSKRGSYKGENLWMCTKDHTPEESMKYAVNSWYSEIEFTDEGLVGPDGEGDGGIVAHYTQLVWARTTRVGCALGKVGGEGSFVVCQYGPGGNFNAGYPHHVNGPVRTIGDCKGKAKLRGKLSKRDLLPKKTRRCRHKARKSCSVTKILRRKCLAEINVKCKVKGIEIHEPKMCHDPNTADYCPCCMNDAQLDSGNLDEEEEPEMETCDKQSTEMFLQSYGCGGGLNGHQEIVHKAGPMTQFAINNGGSWGRWMMR
jgi:hypothetical protein